MAAMSRAAKHSHHTFADYVALEARDHVPHAFLDGQIYAIPPGTPEQAALAAAVRDALEAQLRGKPYRVYGSELRVGVPTTGLVTHPDVIVACDPVEYDTRDGETVVNPVVLVEVTRTLTFDRSDNFGHFKRLASAMDILIVSHRGPWIECWSRRDGTWRLVEARTGQQVSLRSIGCSLDVNAIYASLRRLPASATEETPPPPSSC